MLATTLYVTFLCSTTSGSLYKHPYQAWEYLQQRVIPYSSAKLQSAASGSSSFSILGAAVTPPANLQDGHGGHQFNFQSKSPNFRTNMEDKATARILSDISAMASGLDSASLQDFLSADNRIKNQNVVGLSPKCENQTDHLFDSIVLGEMWAIQMLDAWGKPQAGLLSGVLNWLGDYKECTSIRSTFNSTSLAADVLNYQGQYCTGLHNITVPYNEQHGDKACPRHFIGSGEFLCSACVLMSIFPSCICKCSALQKATLQDSIAQLAPENVVGCDNDDAVAFYDDLVKRVSPKSLRPMAVCQPLLEDKKWSRSAIATYVVFGLMFLLGLSAGLYDFYIHDTLMYYKVHRLPIPVKLLRSHAKSQTSHTHRLFPDDEGNLIQNSELDEDEQPQPRRHVPESTLEAADLAVTRFWLAFSFYSNGYKILTPSQPDGAINCLHGVRFLSLSWVILGHTLVFSMSTIASMQVIEEWLTRFSFQAIINATVAVDSFFMISGLITSYLLLRTFSRQSIGLRGFLTSVPVLYLHRYLRLTPALGFMLLFWIYGVYNFSSGPMWPVAETTDANCRSNSWATMLYVNNLYDPDHECAAWSWFLANDFQFFLIAPFLVGLLYWSGRVGLVVNVLLILVSCSCGVAISYEFNLGISLMNTQGPGGGGGLGNLLNGHWFSDYYVAPWVRFQSYGVGIIYGYLIWRTDGRLRIHWCFNLLLWAVSAALCLLPLYGAFDAQTGKHTATVAENIIYNGLSRTSWSMGLGYLVLACHSGRGGFINELLSWRGFVPLSRMTYCAYLVHPVVMTIVTFSQYSLVQYTDIVYIYMFLSFMFLSYGVAFIFSLMFEAPFLNIDKAYITGALQKKKH